LGVETRKYFVANRGDAEISSGPYTYKIYDQFFTMNVNENNVMKISTRRELELCDIGQLVNKFDRVGVYAGLEWRQTCSCMCPNTFQFPIIVYPTDDESIDKETVFALDPPVPHQIHGYSMIENIDEKNKYYPVYKKLIDVYIHGTQRIETNIH
jgi:hypothetical protein